MPGESHASATGGSVAPRWWQRALPLTAVAVVATVAVVVLGGSSDQVRLSTSRQEQPFVELGLTRAPEQVCGRKQARVRYAVTSHLPESSPLTLRLTIDPLEKGRSTTQERTLTIEPEATVSLRATVDAPRGDYDVVVTVKDRTEALRVHCQAGGR